MYIKYNFYDNLGFRLFIFLPPFPMQYILIRGFISFTADNFGFGRRLLIRHVNLRCLGFLLAMCNLFKVLILAYQLNRLTITQFLNIIIFRLVKKRFLWSCWKNWVEKLILLFMSVVILPIQDSFHCLFMISSKMPLRHVFVLKPRELVDKIFLYNIN